MVKYLMQLGYVTLNISLFIYMIWFIPQIILNFKRKNTEGLSLFMFGILSVGYICDFVYGFGRQMQWQYRLVTIVGLISLAIQHYQFVHYGLHRLSQKIVFGSLTVLYFILVASLIGITLSTQNKNIFIGAGVVATICWLTYMTPQILKNYLNKSTVGLSVWFVVFAIVLNICDTLSAWSLQWDYPSKIGPLVAMGLNLMLLWQIHLYKNQMSIQ